MNDLTIRTARESEHEAIQDATLAAYQEYSDRLSPPLWEHYRQNILDTLADAKPGEQIVAERSGSILGAVLLYPAATEYSGPAAGSSVSHNDPEVRLLAVPPAARRQGVGAALMQECVRRSREAGAAAVTLHTTDMMKVAQQLYQRMGFVRAPELDFRPIESVVIQGYRLDLGDSAT